MTPAAEVRAQNRRASRGLAHKPAALAVVIVALLTALVGVGASPAAVARARTAPRIGHVFVIVLENQSYDSTFGPASAAPYLAHELPAQGALLRQYYGIGHESLDNYIAMVSGQAPNPQTQADCQIYSDFVEPVPGYADGDGQAIGTGCVYPVHVATVADQLQAAGRSWRGYMQDMGEPCRHPALNRQDDTQSAEVGDQYAARHDPFVYFHSIIDEPSCGQHVVDLSQLPRDFRRGSSTPTLSFITPDLCSDGHDSPCVDGRPGGLTSADAFLRTWVPKITGSPAFKRDGLLVITFDEAETGSEGFDAGACCGEGPGPNSPLPGIAGLGGGRVGAVLVSPAIRPGTVSDVPYNHYSLLRSIEDELHLGHLGYAGAGSLQSFGPDVFEQ